MISIRRKLMAKMQSGGGRLPAEYQAVEYIGGVTGNEYIITAIIPLFQDAVTIKFQSTAPLHDQNVRPFGAYEPGIALDSVDGLRIWTTGAKWSGFGIDITDGYIHTISCDSDGTWIYDGTTLTTDLKIATQPNNINLTIFKAKYRNNSIYGTSKLRIYDFVYYRNGSAICNLVPCYRKADNVIGMYDLVTNAFLTNAGTGAFEKGNNVY